MSNQLQLHSGTETADGTATETVNHPIPTWAEVQLDVTATADTNGDKLDVFVQTMIDFEHWIDVIHFAQFLGTTTPKRAIAKIYSQTSQAEFDNSTALGAGAVRHHMGTAWRARWDIVNASAPSFTFEVDMVMGFS